MEDSYFRRRGGGAAFEEEGGGAAPPLPGDAAAAAGGFELCAERAAELSLLRHRGWDAVAVPFHVWRYNMYMNEVGK